MELDLPAMRSPTHPHPAPDPLHRKIELQSPLDLAYLQSNIAASARQKLDLHFPPNASQGSAAIRTGASSSAENQNGTEPETDPMRARVQELVTLFLERTWEGAKHNISINGLDANSLHPQNTASLVPADPHQTNGINPSLHQEREGIDFEYEAYDPRLSSKLARLYGDLETLTTQVSKLRRTAPREAAEAYQRTLLASLEEDQRIYEEAAEKARHMPPEEPVLRLNAVDEQWASSVGGMYEKGIRELGRLGGNGDEHSGLEGERGGSLTETVGKVQRAKVVAEELE